MLCGHFQLADTMAKQCGGESGSRTYICRSWFSSLLAISRVPSSAKVTPRRCSPPSPVASLTLSRHAPTRMRRPPLISRIMSSRCRRHFGSGRVRFRLGRLWSPERHRRARYGKPAVLFLSANTARHPAGICAGIGSNRRQKRHQIQMVMVLSDCRPGAPRKKP